jgi:hypothetical protein
MPGEGARDASGAGPSGSVRSAADGSGSVGRAWRIAVPAVISVVAFLVIDLVLTARVGRPWGPAYPLTMDALVLARLGPLFFSGLVVWPAMRARGATRGQAVVGILATPLAFAIVSGLRAATFFPPLEAAYYATNPMVIGAIGAQVSSAGVGALAYALWRARRGHTGAPSTAAGLASTAAGAASTAVGSASTAVGSAEHPVGTGWSWTPVIAIVAGTAVTLVAVIWDGGQHLFYPWVLLYGRIFG